MRMFRFDAEVAHPITQYGSEGVAMGRGVRFEGDAKVGCFHVSPGGVIGYHEAFGAQLFMCVSGEGWVTGTDRRRAMIRPGLAAFWSNGEFHESGSESGMMAIVVEGSSFDPSEFMPEIDVEYVGSHD